MVLQEILMSKGLSMKLWQILSLSLVLGFVVGCSGDTPKGAIPVEKPATKPPAGPVQTNPDGTTTTTGGIGIEPQVQ